MAGQGDNMEILVRRAKTGNKDAMENICISFKGFIVNRCIRIHINGYEMEDLIQEGYKSIVKAVYAYDPERNSFTAYVTSAIQRNLYNIMRKILNKPYASSLNSFNQAGNELLDMILSKENIEDDFVKRESLGELKHAMEKLTPNERDIILWYYVEGRSLGEYAKASNISYRTAVYRKKVSMEKLKSSLQEHMFYDTIKQTRR